MLYFCLINRYWLCQPKGPLHGVSQFLATESSLKMTKNTFYFILTALFILKIFIFFALTFLVTQQNGLIKKLRLISKLMTSSTSKLIIK